MAADNLALILAKLSKVMSLVATIEEAFDTLVYGEIPDSEDSPSEPHPASATNGDLSELAETASAVDSNLYEIYSELEWLRDHPGAPVAGLQPNPGKWLRIESVREKGAKRRKVKVKIGDLAISLSENQGQLVRVLATPLAGGGEVPWRTPGEIIAALASLGIRMTNSGLTTEIGRVRAVFRRAHLAHLIRTSRVGRRGRYRIPIPVMP